VQARLGESLTLEEKIHIFKQQPDFVCLPEYYMLGADIKDFHRAALKNSEYLSHLIQLSDQLSSCLIGGTIVDATNDNLYNSCYIINRGLVIDRYWKRSPVPAEARAGITPGNKPLVIDVEGVRIGFMICGDVFQPRQYDEMGRAGVDIIFIPTTSPYRADDSISHKNYRDKIYFIDGAIRSKSFVVKVCGVGELFGRPLQGRSLVASPWGLISKVDFDGEHEKRIVSITLDLDEIREFRHKMKRQVDWLVDEKQIIRANSYHLQN
jgi:predicted amidohydrolase